MKEVPPIPEPTPPATTTPRCGTVALVGRSNVGKSTLLNRILGAKVAITSDKPQTTRSRILGIRTIPGAQMIWVDTPGLHRARSLLNRRMVDAANRSLDEADVVVAVVDAAVGLLPEDRHAIDRVAKSRHPWLIAVNKIDLRSRAALLPILEAIAGAFPNVDLVPVSAAKGTNLEALERAVVSQLPAGDPQYPEDDLTDQTSRALVQEFVREQIFRATDGEIPYRTTVIVDQFEEKPRVNVVTATILVERDSQKRIMIGAGGSMIKDIGSAARRELEKFFDKRFFLELFVKVRRDWTKNPRTLNELGL
jgi:GTP-binding protein Era